MMIKICQSCSQQIKRAQKIKRLSKGSKDIPKCSTNRIDQNISIGSKMFKVVQKGSTMSTFSSLFQQTVIDKPDIWEIFEFETFLKNADPPVRSI